MANEKVLPSALTLKNGNDHDADVIKANDNYLRDQVYVDTSAPATPNKGQLWIDGNFIKFYDGSNWIPIASIVQYWTTATRPSPGANDYPIGFNTDTSQFEGYNGSAWVIIG